MKRAIYLSLMVVLIVACLLAAVSCGTSSPTTPKTDTRVKPTGTETPGPDYKPFAVTIKDMAFSPATVEVAIGTTVTWTNEDFISHTATSRTGIFDSGTMSKGSTFSYTFTAAGNFEYYCIPHPSMIGHVIVK
jgi:plastocyanin